MKLNIFQCPKCKENCNHIISADLMEGDDDGNVSQVVSSKEGDLKITHPHEARQKFGGRWRGEPAIQLKLGCEHCDLGKHGGFASHHAVNIYHHKGSVFLEGHVEDAW
jgi:hypothetical protein